ncbi:MAG: GC-type dockerin domain-anchored protein [Planctomycetota bacterium]
MSLGKLASGLGAFGVAAATGAASAQVDPGDIGLGIENGQIVTFLLGEDEGGGSGPLMLQRVFLAELGVVEFEPGDGTPGSGGSDVFQSVTPAVSSFSTNTPGFDSGPGVFAPGTSVGFNIAEPFSVYRPSRGSFEATTAVFVAIQDLVIEALLIEFNTTIFQTNAAQFGFPVGTSFPNGGLPVFSNGRFHRHLNFTMLPVNGAGTASFAEPGVYALTLELTSTDPGVMPSEPIILLFAFGVPETSQEFLDAQAEAIRLTGGSGGDPVDFDGNGVVNISDLFAFIGAFTQTPPAPTTDFDGNGVINISDLFAFITAFTASP